MLSDNPSSSDAAHEDEQLATNIGGFAVIGVLGLIIWTFACVAATVLGALAVVIWRLLTP